MLRRQKTTLGLLVLGDSWTHISYVADSLSGITAFHVLGKFPNWNAEYPLNLLGAT